LHIPVVASLGVLPTPSSGDVTLLYQNFSKWQATHCAAADEQSRCHPNHRRVVSNLMHCTALNKPTWTPHPIPHCSLCNTAQN